MHIKFLHDRERPSVHIGYTAEIISYPRLVVQLVSCVKTTFKGHLGSSVI